MCFFNRLKSCVWLLIFAARPLMAADLYVTQKGANLAPYTNWTMAAWEIQSAVDAAAAGDTIWVTNGVYENGARTMGGLLPNRVVVDKALVLRSVNGPGQTAIKGAGDIGDMAIRAVYLTNGASLIGFTITNGHTRAATNDWRDVVGGGIYCEGIDAVISNCMIATCRAQEYGAGAYYGTFYNCTFVGNSSLAYAGAACDGRLHACTLTDNTADNAGGAVYYGWLTNCTLSGNKAYVEAGAACEALLRNCVLTGNSSMDTQSSGGGAASLCTLYDCLVVSNLSLTYGGGLVNCEAIRCRIAFNQADQGGGGVARGHLHHCFVNVNTSRYGGGAMAAELNNCTLVGNSAMVFGGGVFSGQVHNCIVYYNTCGLLASDFANWFDAEMDASCTVPLPANGGNLTNEPMLAGLQTYQIIAASPCIDAGAHEKVKSDWDIEGDPWGGNLIDIGADEYVAGSMTGQIDAVLSLSHTQVCAGFAVGLEAGFSGRVQGWTWTFGDGGSTQDLFRTTHIYTETGSFDVVLDAYNNSGVIAVTATVSVAAPASFYVKPGGSDVADGRSWDNAKASIQAAVDAVMLPGSTIWVTNGVYSWGGVSNSRVYLHVPVTLRSVNGRDVSVISGGADTRCIWIDSASSLQGFTLTNGALGISGRGGAVYCTDAKGEVRDCIVAGNSAGQGGGVYGGQLRECKITHNYAESFGGGLHGAVVSDCEIMNNYAYCLGGGAYDCLLRHCRLTCNAAAEGGAVYNGILYNCLVVDNSSETTGGGVGNGRLINCSVTANSANGMGGGLYGNPDESERPYGASAVNTLLYYNEAPAYANHYNAALSFCCTTPLADDDFTSMTNEPLIVSAFNPRLLASSPCIDAGYTQPVAWDLDSYSDLRLNGEVDIGADEYWPGIGVDELVALIVQPYNYVCVGYSLAFDANIQGEAQGFVWDFGDGVLMTNICRTEHGFATQGLYQIVLTVSNAGGSTTFTAEVDVIELRRFYVTMDGKDSHSGMSWEEAKATLQSAADAAWAPGSEIIVSNGFYAVGGSNGSRLHLKAPLNVYSVNGPEVTTIQGGPSNRCAFLIDGSKLAGFTLSGAVISNDIGGGALCTDQDCLISNCFLIGNLAAQGGGGHLGIYRNCLIAGNSSRWAGGGVHLGRLYDCQVLTNYAVLKGGGVYESTLEDCILAYNTAMWGGGACLSSLLGCSINDNTASDEGGGVYGGTLFGCTLENNEATIQLGGGASEAELVECNVIANRAPWGGGLYDCTMYGGFVESNLAFLGGGGVKYSRVHDCTIAYNTAGLDGGGAMESRLYRCRIRANRAMTNNGGGVFSCKTFNSLLIENSAQEYGGAAADSELVNCTVAFNSAGVSGGGVAWGGVRSSVVYDNLAADETNWLEATLDYTCTTPIPADKGCISNRPHFVDAAATNLRLCADSPCIDGGANEEWLFYETDLDGRPRVFNKVVDMGAYEYTIRTEPRLFLQGPFKVESGSMALDLNQAGLLPLTAPYASDRQILDAMPTNVIDWVLLELRETNETRIAVSQSLLLRKDGALVEPYGDTNLYLQVHPGARYYLALKHRNHSAVITSAPVTFTGDVVVVDFTLITNGTVQLTPGLYGMPTGDADGDGRITAVDQAINQAQQGRTGYLCGDFNLNGKVE